MSTVANRGIVGASYWLNKTRGAVEINDEALVSMSLRVVGPKLLSAMADFEMLRHSERYVQNVVDATPLLSRMVHFFIGHVMLGMAHDVPARYITMKYAGSIHVLERCIAECQYVILQAHKDILRQAS